MDLYTSLTGVDARLPDDAWAVGTAVDESRVGHSLALHWDGRVWTDVPTPSPGLYDNALSGIVALAPGDAWAVGHAANHGPASRSPVTLHWDGTRWNLVRTPFLRGQLNGVAAGRNGELWAAGYRESPASTLIEQPRPAPFDHRELLQRVRG